MLSSILAVVQKSIKCACICVSQMYARGCAAVGVHEEKRYIYICAVFCCVSIVVMLADDVEVF